MNISKSSEKFKILNPLVNALCSKPINPSIISFKILPTIKAIKKTQNEDFFLLFNLSSPLLFNYTMH